jgi:SAM-dependent methyltransferase
MAGSALDVDGRRNKTMLAKFLARQLGNPSGIFGRFVLAPLWNKRNSALNDAAFDRLALRPHDRVLEVGFGGGYLLGRMAAVVAEGFLAGVDVSPAMVAFCQKRFRSLVEANKLDLKCATAQTLPYPSGFFTKVCTVNSIFYWENVPQAISELWRVLEENGMLVMCFTCKTSLEDKQFAQHGLALYEDDQIGPMMKAAGFHAVSVTRALDRHREFLCVTGAKLQVTPAPGGPPPQSGEHGQA